MKYTNENIQGLLLRYQPEKNTYNQTLYLVDNINKYKEYYSQYSKIRGWSNNAIINALNKGDFKHIGNINVQLYQIY